MMWMFLVMTTIQGSSSVSDVVAKVTCAEIAFSQSVERRDREAFASFLHPDARFISGRVSRGADAVAEAWSGYFKPDGPRIRWRPEIVEVNEEGTIALSRGPYRIVEIDANGQRNERWGSFISVWVLGNDGRWRVHFDTGANHGMTPSHEIRQLLEADSSCAAEPR